MDLARSAARGAATTLAGQWTRLVVQIGSTMVLARLLTPEVYGLVGMVYVFVVVAMLLKDLGLNTATVQRREITDEQINTLFWINLALGTAIAVLFWALAPAVADFYGQPELTGIVGGLSLAVVFGSLAAQPQALLTRGMDFTSTTIIDVIAMASGAVTAITAALLGAGYWALVLLHVSQQLVRAVLVWRPCRWRPHRPSRCEDLRSLLSFGGYLSVTRFLGHATPHIDRLLIGRYVGAAQLGYYAKAYELLVLPLRQIQDPLARVAVSTLSKLQDDPARYRRYFTTALGGVSFISMPVFALLYVLAEDAVLILLGDQWTTGTVPLFRILALAGIAMVVSHTMGWLFVSLGRTRRHAIWFVVTRPLFIAAVVAGLPWGARGVAIGYTATTYALVVPFYVVATRGTPVGLRDVARAAWHPAVISIGTYAAASLVRAALDPQPLVLRVAGTLATAAIAFVGLTMIWPAARKQAMTFLAVARDSLRRRRADSGSQRSEPASEPVGDPREVDRAAAEPVHDHTRHKP